MNSISKLLLVAGLATALGGCIVIGGTGSGSSCRYEGQTCSFNSDCCGAGLCNSSTSKCDGASYVDTGGACSTSAQCRAGRTCSASGTCQLSAGPGSTCRYEGQVCASNSDCCGPGLCNPSTSKCDGASYVDTGGNCSNSMQCRAGRTCNSSNYCQ